MTLWVFVLKTCVNYKFTEIKKTMLNRTIYEKQHENETNRSMQGNGKILKLTFYASNNNNGKKPTEIWFGLYEKSVEVARTLSQAHA
jgi:hypothetical protein